MMKYAEVSLACLASDYFKVRGVSVSSWLISSVRLLNAGKTDAFRDSFTEFLSGIPYDSHDSTKTPELTEKHFQYTFYLILRLIGVYCLRIE